MNKYSFDITTPYNFHTRTHLLFFRDLCNTPAQEVCKNYDITRNRLVDDEDDIHLMLIPKDKSTPPLNIISHYNSMVSFFFNGSGFLGDAGDHVPVLPLFTSESLAYIESLHLENPWVAFSEQGKKHHDLLAPIFKWWDNNKDKPEYKDNPDEAYDKIMDLFLDNFYDFYNALIQDGYAMRSDMLTIITEVIYKLEPSLVLSD